MKRFMLVMLALGLFTVLVPSPTAVACPYCKEAVAIASDPEDGDPLREARAYNYSIYLMVGMPYLLLGAVGLMVYRSIKVAQRKAGQEQQDSLENPSEL